MTVLMLGFDSSYPPLLERAINDKSIDFVAEVDDDTAIDLLIVNGDELQSIRRFEELRLQINSPAFVVGYSAKEIIQQDLAIEISEENASCYFPMPLDLQDISLALLNTDFSYTKPMDGVRYEEQKDELEVVLLRRKARENAHRMKNLWGALDLLEGLQQLDIIDIPRYKEIAKKLIRPEEDTPHRGFASASNNLSKSAPTILLIDDDAVFAQWKDILGELFAAKLKTKLEFVTRLDAGLELIREEGAKYSAVLLDVRFEDEDKSGANLWKGEKEKQLLKKIPVVMFSAVDEGHTVKTCLLDHAVDYFIKDLPSEEREPRTACEELVEIMEKAMSEDRRWIFADALEKAKSIIPQRVRKEIVSDLDDMVRYLFHKPKLSLFCAASADETFKEYYECHKYPDGYYHWLGNWFRNIIAHNLFGDNIGYHSLDAEILFWNLMTLCNLFKTRNKQTTAIFETAEYFRKLRNLARNSNCMTNELENLLGHAQGRQYQAFFKTASDIIGEYILEAITAYYDKTLTQNIKYRFYIKNSQIANVVRPTNVVSAIRWLLMLDLDSIRNSRAVVAIALNGKDQFSMDKLQSLHETLEKRNIRADEHMALFSAICVRLALIQKGGNE